MTKAEKFIKDYTNSCSNELISVQDRFHNEVISYREWLTPEQALRAVEIERDELLDKACEYLQEHLLIDYWSQSVANESKFIDKFINYMKGE